ncbi:MATE family efflux transporter [Aliiglaciecola sp. CAU 1673]|uniref:MATE family efflux transporter n=1 Tax=Aliiglaciecola sp. CAU 1673 TaxID=3032595 RepID=UPI0023DB1EAF|nr:MATE family efflux transporter [Aliiglaciecola sp. CAU 1673]MDF2179489.1 MATE family efflux transporter [Aliiglaciecola sp. CAU 1673]
MQDLTQGSIPRHLVQMAIPIAIGMFVQTLYFLVDLYFIGHLGAATLAGVSAAGNATFVIIALTQILNVGTAALVSHAAGRKEMSRVNQVFNQSLLLSALMMILVMAVGYGFAEQYLGIFSEDQQVIVQGSTYLYWFLPNLGLQFCLVAMGAAMRGLGMVKPMMQIQLLTVLLNIILAPVLISGLGTGIPLGVAGAGLASSLAALVGVVMLWRLFHKLEHSLRLAPDALRPQWSVWRKLLGIGFPSGAEFVLMFLYMAVIYWAIQRFGADAQAGFGLGSRVMQALLLPAMALGFAAPTIVGQNFGAQQADRIKETFKWSVILSIGLMACLTMLCLTQASWLVGGFTDDPGTLAIATGFLTLIAWNFVPSCLVFCCSGFFQGLGNTWPSLISSATRILTFAIPAVWLSAQQDFQIEQLWYLSIVTVMMQALLSLYLLKGQLRKRLAFV